MQNFFNIFTAKAYLDARDKTNEPDIIPHHIVKSKGKLKLVAPLTANTDDEVVVSVELTANRSGKIIKRKFKYKDDSALLAFLTFNEYSNVLDRYLVELDSDQVVEGYNVVAHVFKPWGLDEECSLVTIIKPEDWEELGPEFRSTITEKFKGRFGLISADYDGDIEPISSDIKMFADSGTISKKFILNIRPYHNETVMA